MTTSRLKRITDAKNEKTNYRYRLDDRVQQIAYTDAVIATPSVSFTYDAAYGRLATMVDGTGTTTYGYHPVLTPRLGATQLASVDGPLANDTITYTYDELGRVTARAVDGPANTVAWAFDALGRVTSETNVLGSFTYGYDGSTSRNATVTYPNGQVSEYADYGNTIDRRLHTIHHKYPNASTLSRFDYTYDAEGNILTWRQQADATAVLWEYGYDLDLIRFCGQVINRELPYSLLPQAPNVMCARAGQPKVTAGTWFPEAGLTRIQRGASSGDRQQPVRLWRRQRHPMVSGGPLQTLHGPAKASHGLRQFGPMPAIGSARLAGRRLCYK